MRPSAVLVTIFVTLASLVKTPSPVAPYSNDCSPPDDALIVFRRPMPSYPYVILTSGWVLVAGIVLLTIWPALLCSNVFVIRRVSVMVRFGSPGLICHVPPP